VPLKEEGGRRNSERGGKGREVLFSEIAAYRKLPVAAWLNTGRKKSLQPLMEERITAPNPEGKSVVAKIKRG